MTVIEIRNERLQAEVLSEGAELASLIKHNHQHNWIWPAKPLWVRSTPHLFPIVGKLANDHTKVSDKEYKMSQHGFARDISFSVINKTDDSVTLSLSNDEETLKKYPFHFRFEVEYQLSENFLKLIYRVYNTGSISMPFNIGWHPGFVLPKQTELPIYLKANESLGSFHLLKDGLIDLNSKEELDNDHEITIDSQSFDKDALVFLSPKADSIKLSDKDGNTLVIHTGGAPYLGLWSKDSSQFICIEPWWGVADISGSKHDLSQKFGIQTLQAGQSWSSEIQVEII